MVAKKKLTHKMPDGTVMAGKAHGVKKATVKKQTPKK